MFSARIESFGGMLPIVSRRLLPDSAAAYAANTDLTTGELRAVRYPAPIHAFASNIAKAYRIPDREHPEAPVWFGLVSPLANLVRSPFANDLYRRHIYIDNNDDGVSARLYENSLDRIIAGDPPYLLGVPAPTATLGVVPTGGSGPTLTRAYLFTYSNLWGEEGQPSAPTTATGFITATWTLTSLEAPADYAARGLTHINIYRTITSAGGGTDYFRVAQIDITDTGYADLRPDSEVAAEGIILASLFYAEPEAMDGFVQMPNGILAGWKGNQVFFSESYRPWAWPVEYIISVRYDIVACGVIDQTLVVLTTGAPSFITGSTPASMSVADSPVVEPCLSARGVSANADGIVYVSRNGLILIDGNGPRNITAGIIEQKEWRLNYAVHLVGMARHESQLVVFQSNGVGYIVDARDSRVALQRLKGFSAVNNIWVDPFTGETHLSYANTCYLWGASDASYATALWRSKEFHTPKPINIGAALVMLDSDYDADAVSSEVITPAPAAPVGGPWDDLSSVIGYSRIFGAPIGVNPAPGDLAPGNGAGTAGWPNWPGVIAYWAGFDSEESLVLPEGVLCILRAYAGRTLVWSRAVESNTTYKLPSGFKSDIWQFALVSRVPVYSLQLAETAKELGNV